MSLKPGDSVAFDLKEDHAVISAVSNEITNKRRSGSR